MQAFRQWLRQSPVASRARAFYKSPYYMAFCATMMLFSFVTGFVVLAWCITMTVAALSMLVSEDMIAVWPPTFCAPFFISTDQALGRLNAPSPLLATSNLIVLGILVLYIFACFVMHFVLWGGFLAPFTKKTRLTYFILPLALALLCNGLGADGYVSGNFVFALVTVFCWMVLYLFYFWYIRGGKEAIDYFARSCVFVTLGLVGELAWVFYSHDVIREGTVNEIYIYFGWGINNNFGGIVALLVPMSFYLFAKSGRRAPLYYATACLALLALVLSNSRASLLMGGLAFVGCAVLVCFVGRHKRMGAAFLLGGGICGVTCLILLWDRLMAFVPRYLTVGFADGGRFALWRDTLHTFSERPLFGGGFFSVHFDSYVGSFFPGLAHNTLIELLGAGGLVLFLAYLAYRVATVRLFASKPNLERLFLGLTVLTLLGVSLLDNHMFNVYPLFFYCAALALAEHDHAASAEEAEEPNRQISQISE